MKRDNLSVTSIDTKLLTLQETAERLRVSTRTIRRWIAEKRLRVVRIVPGGSGRALVPSDEIIRLIQGP